MRLRAPPGAVEIEHRLAGILTAKGKPSSPNTKTKIRNVQCAVFSHAVRYEFAAHNPITSVRTSAKRLRIPDVLTSVEFQALMPKLDQRERVMILLTGSTGLRRGELIALRWSVVDFELLQANVVRSIWRNVEGDSKTEASRKPVPLHPVVIDQLMSWRSVTPYNGDDDFVFPSVAKNGLQAIQPDMLLKRHIRPALAELGITKRIGWHSFRHGLAAILRQYGGHQDSTGASAARKFQDHAGRELAGGIRTKEGCSGACCTWAFGRGCCSAHLRTLGGVLVI